MSNKSFINNLLIRTLSLELTVAALCQVLLDKGIFTEEELESMIETQGELYQEAMGRVGSEGGLEEGEEDPFEGLSEFMLWGQGGDA